MMIRNWRDDWGQGDFPFYFVQLANFMAVKNEPGDSAWAELAGRFPSLPGMRQIIVAELTRIQSSCGSAVPLMSLVAERSDLLNWAAAQGEAGLQPG